jgi:hypothetical protein
MTRSVALALALTLTAAITAAADPVSGDDSAPAIFTAHVVGGDLVWANSHQVPVVKEVEADVKKGDVIVKEKRKVTVLEMVPVEAKVPLKTLKVTEASGKPVPDEKLAVLLAKPTPVVFHTGPLPQKYRGLFRETTILIEFPIPDVVPPGVVPVAPETLPPPKK